MGAPAVCRWHGSRRRGILPTMTRTNDLTDYYDRFYEGDGFAYYPPAFTRAVLRRVCACCGTPPRARVLDVGCATGYYSAQFRALGCDVTGIDLSATGIRRAQERYPDIAFDVMDATQLTFPTGSFDLVFALGVSLMNTHALGDIRMWLTRSLRVLRPGGALALLGGSNLSGGPSAHSDWLNHTWDELWDMLPRDVCTVEGPYLTHFRLMRALPAALCLNSPLTQMLRVAGGNWQRRVVAILRPPASQ
jgi:SAM-dependent methyltransferase